jgi:putative hydrolase of HD superfamily
MPESVADHSFRGAVIAFVVAEIEGIDPFRTAVICLFHDLNEIRLLEREFCDNGRPINASAKICALPYK